MSPCCLYHENPLPLDTIYLPAYVCFHGPNNQKLVAILLNEKMGRLYIAGKITTSWSAACQKAFQLCNTKRMPRLCNHNFLWSINIEGRDVFLNQLKENVFVHARREELEPINDMFCRNCDVKSDSIRTKDDVMKYYKVILKLNTKNTNDVQESAFKKRVSKRDVYQAKQPAEIINKPRKMKKDESFLIEDDDEETDDFTWTPDEDEWTTENFEEFVMRYPQCAPILLRIQLEFKTLSTSRQFCNPIYECIFQHPISKKEMLLDVGSAVLYNVPSYEVMIRKYRSGST